MKQVNLIFLCFASAIWIGCSSSSESHPSDSSIGKGTSLANVSMLNDYRITVGAGKLRFSSFKICSNDKPQKCSTTSLITSDSDANFHQQIQADNYITISGLDYSEDSLLTAAGSNLVPAQNYQVDLPSAIEQLQKINYLALSRCRALKSWQNLVNLSLIPRKVVYLRLYQNSPYDFSDSDPVYIAVDIETGKATSLPVDLILKDNLDENPIEIVENARDNKNPPSLYNDNIFINFYSYGWHCQKTYKEKKINIELYDPKIDLEMTRLTFSWLADRPDWEDYTYVYATSPTIPDEIVIAPDNHFLKLTPIEDFDVSKAPKIYDNNKWFTRKELE